MYGSSTDIRGCQRGCQAFSKAALAMHVFDLPTVRAVARSQKVVETTVKNTQGRHRRGARDQAR